MTTTSHSRAGLTLSVAFVLAVFAHAQTPGQDGQSSTQPLTLSDAQAPESIDETSDSWFVELLSPPTADGSPLAQVRLDKDNFRAAARAARLQYSERYAYDSLWNGLSVRIARRDLWSGQDRPAYVRCPPRALPVGPTPGLKCRSSGGFDRRDSFASSGPGSKAGQAS